MHLSTPDCRQEQRGFSIIEVMVALIVIVVGLLGLAKMQALALSNMNTSRMQALAAIEAASLASAMHSNRAYWASSTVPATTTVTLNPVVITSTDSNLATTATTDYTGGATGLAACVGTSGGGAKCAAPGTLAGYDLANWVNDLAQILPTSNAIISCTSVSGSPPACTINIRWNERVVSITQQAAQYQATVSSTAVATAGSQTFQQPYFFLYVEP
jgi:type IV pilus assembly protein PilV